MFLVKCIPILGTGVTAIEALQALADGDGKGFVSKVAQTGVGAALDVAFVMSGGASSILTAPIQGGAIEGGKIVGKQALKQLLVKEAGAITTNVVARAVTEKMIGGDRPSRSSGWNSGSGSGKSSTSTGSGSGNDPPKDPELPKEHEVEEVDYDSVVDTEGPISEITLSQNGRVEKLRAVVKKCHLKPKGEKRQTITARVRRFIENLGRVVGDGGVRESDEVGHIIADCLGGPCNRTYNYFPQSPYCNMEYYAKVERRIYDYLEKHGGSVVVIVELIYVKHISCLPANRPRTIRVRLEYPNGVIEEIEISNL